MVAHTPTALAELKNEKAELLKESESLQAALSEGELTDQQETRIDELCNRLEELDVEISETEKDFRNQERLSRLDRLAKHASEPKKRKTGTANRISNQNPWGRFALGAQLKAVADYRRSGGMQIDPRFRDATGANTQTPSEGGFLVGSDEENDLMSKIYGDQGSILSRVSRTPLSGDSDTLKLRMLKETSRADGSRNGGALTYWEGEGDSTTATQRQYMLLEMSLKKLMAVTYATNELLRHVSALEAENDAAYREEMTHELEDAIINGDGVAKPLGILSSDALITVAAETNQTSSDPLLYENIVNMWARLHPRSQMNAVWLVDQSLVPHLMTMGLTFGTAGTPVYLPANGAADSPFGTIMGRPVLFTEHTAAANTTGDIILADFSQYRLIDKGGIDGQSSTHVSFLTDETAFRWTYLVNGKPKWEDELTPKNGGATLSPFVTLATRS